MYEKSLIEKLLLKVYYTFTSLYFRFVHTINVGSNCRIEFSSRIRGDIKIGDNVSIGRNVDIIGNIDIGEGSKIADFARINTMPLGKIEIGEDCLINVYNIIGSSNKVRIGDHALFAAGIKITDATHGISNMDEITKSSTIESCEVEVGRNCWLGFDVNIIMGGKIGENCVIGSKSLVNKNVPSDSVAVGIPIKVIKVRQ